MGAIRIKLDEKMIIIGYFHDLFIAFPLWYCRNLVPKGEQNSYRQPLKTGNRLTTCNKGVFSIYIEYYPSRLGSQIPNSYGLMLPGLPKARSDLHGGVGVWEHGGVGGFEEDRLTRRHPSTHCRLLRAGGDSETRGGAVNGEK